MEKTFITVQEFKELVGVDTLQFVKNAEKDTVSVKTSKGWFKSQRDIDLTKEVIYYYEVDCFDEGCFINPSEKYDTIGVL